MTILPMLSMIQDNLIKLSNDQSASKFNDKKNNMMRSSSIDADYVLPTMLLSCH